MCNKMGTVYVDSTAIFITGRRWKGVIKVSKLLSFLSLFEWETRRDGRSNESVRVHKAFGHSRGIFLHIRMFVHVRMYTFSQRRDGLSSGIEERLSRIVGIGGSDLADAISRLSGRVGRHVRDARVGAGVDRTHVYLQTGFPSTVGSAQVQRIQAHEPIFVFVWKKKEDVNREREGGGKGRGKVKEGKGRVRDELVGENRMKQKWKQLKQLHAGIGNIRYKRQVRKDIRNKSNKRKTISVKESQKQNWQMRKDSNKAGYTANTSCGWVKKERICEFSHFPTQPLWRTDRRMDGPTDNACPQLKTKDTKV